MQSGLLTRAHWTWHVAACMGAAWFYWLARRSRQAGARKKNEQVGSGLLGRVVHRIGVTRGSDGQTLRNKLRRWKRKGRRRWNWAQFSFTAKAKAVKKGIGNILKQVQRGGKSAGAESVQRTRGISATAVRAVVGARSGGARKTNQAKAIGTSTREGGAWA